MLGKQTPPHHQRVLSLVSFKHYSLLHSLTVWIVSKASYKPRGLWKINSTVSQKTLFQSGESSSYLSFGKPFVSWFISFSLLYPQDKSQVDHLNQKIRRFLPLPLITRTQLLTLLQRRPAIWCCHPYPHLQLLELLSTQHLRWSSGYSCITTPTSCRLLCLNPGTWSWATFIHWRLMEHLLIMTHSLECKQCSNTLFYSVGCVDRREILGPSKGHSWPLIDRRSQTPRPCHRGCVALGAALQKGSFGHIYSGHFTTLPCHQRTIFLGFLCLVHLLPVLIVYKAYRH